MENCLCHWQTLTEILQRRVLIEAFVMMYMDVLPMDVLSIQPNVKFMSPAHLDCARPVMLGANTGQINEESAHHVDDGPVRAGAHTEGESELGQRRPPTKTTCSRAP